MPKSPTPTFDFNSLSSTQFALAVKPILRTSKSDSTRRQWSALSLFAADYRLPIDTPYSFPSVRWVFSYRYSTTSSLHQLHVTLHVILRHDIIVSLLRHVTSSLASRRRHPLSSTSPTLSSFELGPTTPFKIHRPPTFVPSYWPTYRLLRAKLRDSFLRV